MFFYKIRGPFSTTDNFHSGGAVGLLRRARPGPRRSVSIRAAPLQLDGVIAPGEYDLACLPLKLVGSDGAPARAILRPRE